MTEWNNHGTCLLLETLLVERRLGVDQAKKETHGWQHALADMVTAVDQPAVSGSVEVKSTTAVVPVPRKDVCLKQGHVYSFSCKRRGGVRTSRSAAHDEHIGVTGN